MPDVAALIERKKRGEELGNDDLVSLVRGIASEEVPAYQAAAFLMAVWFRGMTSAETAAYTRAIMESGTVIDLSALGPVTADKHSTGGVGDKTSLVIAPLVAACGVPVPMLSGRGLGHTGGTLDKLESMPGFTSEVGIDEFVELVGRVGCAIVGQTPDLAPADRILYALRDVTATVDSMPLIVGSIVGKKLAAGPGALVYDVKVGSGAFLPDEDAAWQLAQALVDASQSHGREASALLTAMDVPLGRAVGNALEVQEAMDTLAGGGPGDFRELCLALSQEMLVLTGQDAEEARSLLEKALGDGSAMDHFRAFVSAQGGDPGGLPRAPVCVSLPSPTAGTMLRMDARSVGVLVGNLGAGRKKLDDAVDPRVGLVLYAKPGDSIDEGAPLADIHAATDEDAAVAASAFLKAIAIGDGEPDNLPLVLGRVTAGRD